MLNIVHRGRSKDIKEAVLSERVFVADINFSHNDVSRWLLRQQLVLVGVFHSLFDTITYVLNIHHTFTTFCLFF